MSIPLALGVQLAIASALGAGVIAACRWLRRRSALCALLVTAGVLLRASLAVFLFWTSYLDTAMLRSLHTGDGFWRLAVDAPLYYDGALTAVYEGFDTVTRGSASPAFVKTLALWMWTAGASPISGAYLNLVLYVLISVIVVAAFRPAGNWRADLPCLVMLGALSFSPVLVVYSSQPLKDTIFVCLIGILCLTARGFLPAPASAPEGPGGSIARRFALAAIFLGAIYVIGGIRAYYDVIVWSALALVLLVFAWRQRPARFVPYVVVSILLLTGTWLSYQAGADLDYINPYAPTITRAWALVKPAAGDTTDAAAEAEPSRSVVNQLDRYRAGFVMTPGATNINSRKTAARRSTSSQPIPESPVADVPIGLPPTGGLKGRLSAVGLGLALIFVPVSVLKALSIVDFAGGRGLLVVTDVDTLFLDLTTIAVIVLMVRRWPAARGRLAYVCFASTLAIAAALLMAYIVTNYGTLFRLRLMVAAPIWMLPLALGAWRREPAADAVADLAARTRESFGYEWTYFNRWQDSGEVSFRDCFETADLASLRDARVLDAGCGMGRHARQIAAHVRRVVAVDFSRAIEQAAANTREVGNVDCVQADLLRLPFPDATFDYVYCLGVLHHLGNTDTGLRALVAALKPGGRLRVYLYWKRHGAVGVALGIVTIVRRVTTHLPFWLLRWLCWMLSAGLWLAVILPYRLLAAAGMRGMERWPLSVYTKYPFRILYNDQFDRFSAPLERRYDPEEVSALLESAGLRNVRVEPRSGWIAEGVKLAGEQPCAG